MPVSADKKTLRISSQGVMAQQALSRSAKWQVLSTYERSFYCRDEAENIICVGLNEIGKGPFTLLCAPDVSWPKEQLHEVRSFIVAGPRLIAENSDFHFDLQRASICQDSLNDLENTTRHLPEDLDWLAHQATKTAPQESFGCLIPVFLGNTPENTYENADVFSSFLRKRLLELVELTTDNVLHSLEGFVENGSAGVLEQFIGLGRGLTPSGDDFLAGIIMGTHKMGKHREAALLARHLYKRAQGKTTAISITFYRALAEGWISEPYLQLLEGLGHGKMFERKHLLDRVVKMGSTSGWDTLAGIIFGIDLTQRCLANSKGHTAEAVC